jgi:hypothetical protein
MLKVPMSPAASGLLRALRNRAGLDPDRILLSSLRSCDWQSLTFTGERHEIALRITGQDSDEALARLADNLQDAEFSIPGHVVADIALAGPPNHDEDGSITVELEALTIAE